MSKEDKLKSLIKESIIELLKDSLEDSGHKLVVDDPNDHKEYQDEAGCPLDSVAWDEEEAWDEFLTKLIKFGVMMGLIKSTDDLVESMLPINARITKK